MRESARTLNPTLLATLRPAISDAQPYGFFKTLMLGNDEEILYKVAQILGNLSDRSGTLRPPHTPGDSLDTPGAGGPVQRAIASSGCLEYLVSLLDGKPGPVLEMTLASLEKLADHCTHRRRRMVCVGWGVWDQRVRCEG